MKKFLWFVKKFLWFKHYFFKLKKIFHKSKKFLHKSKKFFHLTEISLNRSNFFFECKIENSFITIPIWNTFGGITDAIVFLKLTLYKQL